MMLRAWLALGTTGAASRLYASTAKEGLAVNYARDRVLDVFSKIAALCEDDDPHVRGEAFAAIDRTLRVWVGAWLCVCGGVCACINGGVSRGVCGNMLCLASRVPRAACRVSTTAGRSLCPRCSGRVGRIVC